MPTTWDGLLAAIIASPDDDALRLITADWLDDERESGERHDPARAEFIRVQVEFEVKYAHHAENGHNHPDCPGCILRHRERELIAKNQVHWRFADLPGMPFMNWITDFRRGFVESLTCSAADWLTHEDALVRATPLREVTLTTRPGWRLYQERPDKGYNAYHFRVGGKVVFVDQTWDGPADDPPGSIANEITRRLLAKEWPSVRTWNLPE